MPPLILQGFYNPLTSKTRIQDVFVVIELFFVTIVRLPPHPPRLRRQLPVIGIELTDRTELRLDL